MHHRSALVLFCSIMDVIQFASDNLLSIANRLIYSNRPFHLIGSYGCLQVFRVYLSHRTERWGCIVDFGRWYKCMTIRTNKSTLCASRSPNLVPALHFVDLSACFFSFAKHGVCVCVSGRGWFLATSQINPKNNKKKLNEIENGHY